MLAADSKVAAGPARDIETAEAADSWKNLIDPVEPFLHAVNQRLAEQVDAFPPNIVPYADYALNGQGKHLRPALVALSANAMPRDIEKGLQAGFFQYLTKPIKVHEFMETLDVALEFAGQEAVEAK